MQKMAQWSGRQGNGKNQDEQQKGKRMIKNETRLRELIDIIKHENTHIIGITEKEREKCTCRNNS